MNGKLCYHCGMVVPLIKTMRLKQWPKNGFIFTAIIFDRQLTNRSAFLHTLAGFFLFCLLSSAVYIINDLIDVEADRHHPQKRLRPIASGQLSEAAAKRAFTVIILVVYPLAYLLSPLFAGFALVYFLLNLIYSSWLKNIPILDVFALASFYVLRVAAGVVLIEVARFSPWLYVFTIFLSLFLGVGKRRAEMALLADNANTHRKVLEEYTLPFLDQMITIVVTVTIVTYSLYSFSAPNLPANHAMMLTIPFVLYGVFRYLYLIQVKDSGGAPEDILFTDYPFLINILIWGLAVLVVLYLF
jgi:4-hydroxybenzoate polyprenyltransferase